MKINYVDKVKESAKSIDFDDTARRIFEEYIDFDYKCAKNIYKKIQSLPKDNFYNRNNIHVEKYVNRIFAGLRNDERGQHLHHEYCRLNDNQAELKGVVITEMKSYVGDTAIIENSENYVKQLFNLAQAVGSNIKTGYPKNEGIFHYFFETDFQTIFYLAMDKQNQYFNTLLYRYMYYNSMIFDKRIQCNNKEEQINQIINNNIKSLKLYEHLKSFFNNIDFIYAILKFLDSDDKIDLYNLCLDKNENWMSHQHMDNLMSYTSASYNLFGHNCPKKVFFIRDFCDEMSKEVKI